jgi:hypothetical protein
MLSLRSLFWRTRALQTTGFVDSIGPWVPEASKVCVFIMVSACVRFQKPLQNQAETQNCAIRKALMSFALPFKNHYKTLAKIKSGSQ